MTPTTTGCDCRLFDLIETLTQRQDSLSLTDCFIGQLRAHTSIDRVCIFEVYVADRELLPGSPRSVKGYLIREALGDISQLRQLSDLMEPPLIDLQPENNPCFSGKGKVVFPIPSKTGVTRLLSLQVKQLLTSDDWSLIVRLLEIYTHLVRIFDDKERDKLTGLLNRQIFENHLVRILEYSRLSMSHSGRPSEGSNWMAVVDIDHFKRINDRFGHLYGDEVLLLLARLMTAHFRHTDLLFRLGGEEFVIIVVCTDAEGCHQALERFRLAVSQFAFPTVGQVTVSIGCVELHPHELPSTLFDQADQALYAAKQNGRDRLVFHPSQGSHYAAPEDGTVEIF
ncbi:Diguanylate cyclase (GGDEF) domain [Gammaproteobacteria bacterium]